MAKSVILCVVVFVLVLTVSTLAAGYVQSTCQSVLSNLEGKEESLENRFSSAYSIWEERKAILMLISNHKDIEAVSLSLIRGRENARLGGEQMAKTELEAAIFLIKEFAERERLISGNVV